MADVQMFLSQLEDDLKELETSKEMSDEDKQENLENCKSLLKSIEFEKPKDRNLRRYNELRERVVHLETRVGYPIEKIYVD